MNSCLLLTVSMALLGLSWASLHEEDIFLDHINVMTGKAVWMIANHDGKCPNKMKVPATAIICSSADEPPCQIVFNCITVLKRKYTSDANGVLPICTYGKSTVWEDFLCHVNEFAVQCKRHLQCMWIKQGDVDEETSSSEQNYIEYDYPELDTAIVKCDEKTEHMVWLEGGMEVCKYTEQNVTCDYTYTCAKKDHTSDVIGVNVSDPNDKHNCDPTEYPVKESLCNQNRSDCQISWICLSFGSL